MRVQAAKLLKNPTRDELLEAGAALIRTAENGGNEHGFDDFYELVVTRTPQPRKSPIDLPITAPEIVPDGG